jgi:hypothetical protein
LHSFSDIHNGGLEISQDTLEPQSGSEITGGFSKRRRLNRDRTSHSVDSGSAPMTTISLVTVEDNQTQCDGSAGSNARSSQFSTSKFVRSQSMQQHLSDIGVKVFASQAGGAGRTPSSFLLVTTYHAQVILLPTPQATCTIQIPLRCWTNIWMIGQIW